MQNLLAMVLLIVMEVTKIKDMGIHMPRELYMF